MTTNLHSPISIPPSATVLSAGFLGLGALHLLAPLQTCKFFGLPCSSCRFPGARAGTSSATATAKKPLEHDGDPGALPFIYANGGRELMLSIAFLIMGVQRNRDGLRALMFGISVAAQIDAYVVWAYGGERNVCRERVIVCGPYGVWQFIPSGDLSPFGHFLRTPEPKLPSKAVVDDITLLT
ncbi:hypothetical protein VTN77DRAFT_5584 [Rasamsonia byssochlamydoides]|uniref:uncharacterized protein n=1 Tax=Rasamsonia byssochlamydoides TaxID=89139 RepID=UPI003742B3CC